MKIKPEFKLRTVGGVNIVVSTAGMDFQGMITVNETAAFIWKMLETGAEPAAIVDALAEECGIAPAEIRADVDDFIAKLEGAGIVE